MKSLVSFVFLLLCFASGLGGETVFVPAQYESINFAIQAASQGDTVLVSPGTYYEHIDFAGKDIVLASHFVLDSNPVYIGVTQISGEVSSNPDSGTVIIFQNGESNAAQLIGFTIRDGFGTLVGGRYIGGGILCRNNSHPKICHNIIRNNNSLEGGGCAFIDSDPLFHCNRVYSNRAVKGGGMYLDNSRVQVDRCIFAYNRATDQGGAVQILLSDGPLFQNSVFYRDSAAFVGGINCFFSFPTIQYNDFHSNPGGNLGDCHADLGDTTQCLNFNRIPCDGYYNIYRDPLFINPQQFDFSLSPLSPLIDAGSDTTATFPFHGIRTDIGYFEFDYFVGDCNVDGIFNVSDVSFLINYIFDQGPAPLPLFSADFDCDRRINIVDVQLMINYIFKMGPGPCSDYTSNESCL